MPDMRPSSDACDIAGVHNQLSHSNEDPLMTMSELAKDFTDLLKQNDHEGAAEKYNADDIVSYEALDGPKAEALTWPSAISC